MFAVNLVWLCIAEGKAILLMYVSFSIGINWN